MALAGCPCSPPREKARAWGGASGGRRAVSSGIALNTDLRTPEAVGTATGLLFVAQACEVLLDASHDQTYANPPTHPKSLGSSLLIPTKLQATGVWTQLCG